MSDFEKWFKSLNKNGRVTYFLGQEGRISEEAWNHQQTIIDDLIYKAKLRESDHRALLVKYQATKKCWEDVSGKCEELKAQLNNMEACYIEKKKELEELQGQLRTWKGQSLAAMLHGTCKCGEPWQSIVSDKESFNRLHCFNCNNDRYENKEFFGDHEPKSLRGAND